MIACVRQRVCVRVCACVCVCLCACTDGGNITRARAANRFGGDGIVSLGAALRENQTVTRCCLHNRGDWAVPQSEAWAGFSSAIRESLALRYVDAPCVDAATLAELRRRYRAPRVRLLVRTRAMCLAGRAAVAAAAGEEGAAAAAAGAAAAWLCVRAPLWVVVRVCELLRER
jgi:hypothetical protein